MKPAVMAQQPHFPTDRPTTSFLLTRRHSEGFSTNQPDLRPRASYSRLRSRRVKQARQKIAHLRSLQRPAEWVAWITKSSLCSVPLVAWLDQKILQLGPRRFASHDLTSPHVRQRDLQLNPHTSIPPLTPINALLAHHRTRPLPTVGSEHCEDIRHPVNNPLPPLGWR
jgi:hypothetical protein